MDCVDLEDIARFVNKLKALFDSWPQQARHEKLIGRVLYHLP